jgi:hypothetical protein
MGCLAYTHALGQQAQLTGKILDAVLEEPVAGAHIFDRLQAVGTVTGEKGEFSLTVSQWPLQLEISCVGYASMSITVPAKEVAEFTVLLPPLPNELPQATVSAARTPQDVYPKEEQVLDFVFYQGNIITALHNRLAGTDKLEWRSPDGTVLDALDVKLKGKTSLHKSCLGLVSLINGPEVYQLALDDETILGLTHSGNYHTYFWEVEKCVAAGPANLCYQLERYLGQMVDYRLFGIESDTSYVFCRIADEKQMRLVFEDMAPRMSLDRTTADMTADHPDNLRDIRNAQEDLDGWKHLFFQPVNCPLFAAGGQLLVFDHVNGELRFFSSEGQALSTLPIRYHLEKNWGRSVWQDEVTGKFYTLFYGQNRSRIHEIKLTDGSLGEPFYFSHQTIRKIGISNGTLFFLEEEREDTFGYLFTRLRKLKIS